jgi:uncharacterized protein YbbK (DUF523 family)
MTRFPVPVVVVSKCLGFAACRYDGQVVEDGFVAALGRHARLVTVCPEVEIGLGVPRDKIRLVGTGPERRLVQPATGRDLTGVMGAFAADYLRRLGSGPVDGFILKSRSPSCGIRDCKLFADRESEDPQGRGTGVFAQAVLTARPDLPVEDEERLVDPEVRVDFLARLYERARLREGKEPTGDSPTPFPPELLDR